MFTGRFSMQYLVKGVEPYNLEFDYSFEGGKVIIVGASMLRQAGRYYGYWRADTMPLELLKEAKRQIKKAIANIDWEVES